VTRFPILAELPERFVARDSGDVVFAVRRDAESALGAAGYDAAGARGAREVDLGGRKPMLALDTPLGELLVRRYSHGGLLRWLTGARFLDAERPFREIVHAERLRANGVAAPEVLAARARRLAGGGWELELVTRRIAGATDLAAWIERASRGELGPRERTRLYSAAGRAVARLHELGFVHADLHPRNLLVDATGDAPRITVIDLDRSTWRERLEEAERLANLERMFRYVARRCASGAWRASASDFRRFLAGYDPSGASWKRDWRAIAASHRSSRARHAAGWALERRVAGREGE
jgi:tRNA A-37 threonylcarbamoyl transferase component Bud32